MRKVNGILAGIVLVLFLLHGILGAFQLLGSGHILSKALSHTMMLLVVIHGAIGTKLTIDSIRAQKKAGVFYIRENFLFWARRISGFALLVFLVFHVYAFQNVGENAFRLPPFPAAKLATQLLLVISLAVHLITNIRPMLITFGIRRLRPRAGDIVFILSVLLLFMAISFVVYYLRWSRV